MEQAFAFFTGVIGTLLVLGIVKLILSGNRLRHLEDKIESLEDDLENIHDWVDGIEEETQRLTEALDIRIDGEIDRVDDIHEGVIKYAKDLISDVQEVCSKVYKKRKDK